MDATLIDRLYECAFAPELWPGTLGDLAKVAEARTGFLFLSNDTIHNWASSTQIGLEALQPLVESGWIARSERFARMIATAHAGFLPDTALYTADEMKSDPFYRDILYPRGLGFGVGTTVQLPTGDRFSVALERNLTIGPADARIIRQLDELRPHLARSAFVSARLLLDRARVASETLAALGLPALVLNWNGKVLAVNHLIEALAGFVHWRARDRVSLQDRAADRILQATIATIDLAAGAGVRSFPVRDAGTDAIMVAHVVPVRLSVRDIFARGAAALVLTPVTAPNAPPVELVQSLFDLTPAEARVARGLASGHSVEDIAAASGTSTNTIRTQVRGVLEKTGCNRQVDVVALLTAISSARLPHPMSRA